MRYAFVVLIVCAAATARADDAVPTTQQFDVQWWNDLFADPPPADDQGFTNDFLLGFEWAMARATGRVELFYRIITERYGIRRWDQVDLTGAWQRRWRRGRWRVDASALPVRGPEAVAPRRLARPDWIRMP